MGRKRRTFSAAFKHKVAVEALTERYTLSELAQKYDLHPNQIVKWKQILQKEGQRLFEKSGFVSPFGRRNSLIATGIS